MTLTKLYSLYKTKIWLLLIAGLLGGILSLVFFILFPPKFIASGSFFVSRTVENSTSDFKYEGYYSSLSSMNYARTLAALVESDAVKAKVLTGLERSITRENLKNLGKSVTIKKPETQLVSMHVKALTPKEAEQTWLLYRDALVKTSSSLNGTSGDSNISVVAIDESPVVYESFSNIYILLLLGVLSGVIVSGIALGFYFFAMEAMKREVIQ
jgi:capsular polysaccharide biosynthesis protein